MSQRGRGGAATPAPDDPERPWEHLGEELRRRLGPGVRLEPRLRASFQGRLSADLSGAMVHRGPFAGRLARTLGADALTVGTHVLGSAEQLDPATPRGTALLGHELTHVVQRAVDGPNGAERAEAQAVAVEQTLQQADGQAPASHVDREALAERVYRRLLDELNRERERSGWS